MSVKLIFKSVWNNPGNRGRRMARLCRAAQWQVSKRIASMKKPLRLPNGAAFIAHPDCVVSSALMYAQWPEYHELQFIRRVLQRGQTVIDVGANVGHISLLLSDICGGENIFAFEPTPVSFQRLCENWKANGWRPGHLFQSAVGRAHGSIRVPDTVRPDTKNSVAVANVYERTCEVPLVSLDECRERWAGRSVGLLKIDVEGYEPEVFAGARQFLQEDRPRLIMFESLEGAVNIDIAAVLNQAHYKIFQLDAGRIDFTHVSVQNLFAVPEEHASALH